MFLQRFRMLCMSQSAIQICVCECQQSRHWWLCDIHARIRYCMTLANETIISFDPLQRTFLKISILQRVFIHDAIHLEYSVSDCGLDRDAYMHLRLATMASTSLAARRWYIRLFLGLKPQRNIAEGSRAVIIICRRFNTWVGTIQRQGHSSFCLRIQDAIRFAT
jgi:hypothetical protein